MVCCGSKGKKQSCSPVYGSLIRALPLVIVLVIVSLVVSSVVLVIKLIF